MKPPVSLRPQAVRPLGIGGATLPREPATIVCMALVLAVVVLAVRIIGVW